MAQIGTIYLQHNGSRVEVPVFSTGDVENPFLRVNVGGTTGVLPMYPVSGNDVANDFFRIQHNGTVYGLHNEATLTKWVDEFEDGDFSEYDTSDNTSDFFITSAAAYEGNYGLEFSGDEHAGIYSFSGLDNYPEIGQRFRFYWNGSWTGTPAIWRTYWAVSSSGTWTGSPDYGYRYDHGHDQQTIQKRSGGSTFGLASTSFVPTQGEWYYTTVTWDDGTLGGNQGDISTVTRRASDDVQVVSLGPVNDQDSGIPNTGGGIGFWSNLYLSPAYWDNFYILD